MGEIIYRRTGQSYSPDRLENAVDREYGPNQPVVRSALQRSLPASGIAREVCEEKSPDRAGIVIAGVHCWGESILEQVCPRPLLPIMGRPLISYGLEWMRSGGVHSATICANCQTAGVRAHLGDGQLVDMALDYYEDLMPRGPAGCLRDAALRSNARTFVVVDGSIVTLIDLEALLEAHAASGAALTVVVQGPVDGSDTGRPRLEPVGIYVASRSVVEHIPEKGYQDIKQAIIPRLYESGLRVVPHIVPGPMTLRVTGAASYVTVAGRMVEYVAGRHDQSGEYQRIGQALVHRLANLEPRARLQGKVIIGPDCSIGNGAMIVGPTSLGSGCVVESCAVVTRSVIWSDCRIGRGAFVDRCILVDGAEVERELVARETIWLPADVRPRGLYDRVGSTHSLMSRMPQKARGSIPGSLPVAFEPVSRTVSSRR